MLDHALGNNITLGSTLDPLPAVIVDRQEVVLPPPIFGPEFTLDPGQSPPLVDLVDPQGPLACDQQPVEAPRIAGKHVPFERSRAGHPDDSDAIADPQLAPVLSH